MTPSTMQRDFPRIISETGTPARSPKTRSRSVAQLENSIGLQGQGQTQRPKYPVLTIS